jgi:phage regulator Rha-like protein
MIMNENNIIIQQQEIENRIFTIRGIQVMLDSHLAEMYQIETKYLNRAVKRNTERFPESFMFQLNEEESETLRCKFGTLEQGKSLRFQIGTFKDFDSSQPLTVNPESGRGKHRKYLPYVFTEQGVAMLSAVLRSEIAVKVSIRIIQAFVEMRKMVLGNAALFQRLDRIEFKQLDTDHKFEQVFKALESREKLPDKGIFYDGQVFDAWTFVSDIIRTANQSIILIDNYIDDTVFTLFAKRKEGVRATFYTKTISKQLQLDAQKHNAQYPIIELKQMADAHDRFLIIDETQLYHIGASLKDLGKKWFAFSKMDAKALEMLNLLKIKINE